MKIKILVMGAGALGSAFGGMLANAGHDIMLIGRESHMKPIREHGLRITWIWGSHVMPLAVRWRAMHMVRMRTSE